MEPGGEGVFRWDSGEVRRDVVEEVEPERRLAFRWGDSCVSFQLVEVPEGTRLTVVETAQLRASAHAGEWAWAIELRLGRVAVIA